MTTYGYMVTTPLLLANAQRRMHFHVWSKITHVAREKSRYMALRTKIPHLERVSIEVWIGQGPTPTGRKATLADPGNHYPTVKAVVDGLVDAGVIDDDDGTHVASITMHAPYRSEQHEVRVEITPVD